MANSTKSVVKKSTLVVELICGHCEALNSIVMNDMQDDLSQLETTGLTCWSCKKDSWIVMENDEIIDEEESINPVEGSIAWPDGKDSY